MVSGLQPLGPDEDPEPEPAVPEVRIGPYKLLEKLGEGGMGTVWVAEQTQPVRRRVALKVIKTGMDSQEILQRFEAERQALAMMNHRGHRHGARRGHVRDGAALLRDGARRRCPDHAVLRRCGSARSSSG